MKRGRGKSAKCARRNMTFYDGPRSTRVAASPQPSAAVRVGREAFGFSRAGAFGTAPLKRPVERVESTVDTGARGGFRHSEPTENCHNRQSASSVVCFRDKKHIKIYHARNIAKTPGNRIYQAAALQESDTQDISRNNFGRPMNCDAVCMSCLLC